jgi:hypothetical protein
MAKNRKFADARYLTLAIAAALSGAPVAKGQITGVAQTDTDAAGNTTIDTAGGYDLSVKGVDGGGNSAVAVGDALYYVEADDPKISKKATGIPFGFALGAVAAGATGTITVKLSKF